MFHYFKNKYLNKFDQGSRDREVYESASVYKREGGVI